MPAHFFVTGTDTDIGKTLISTALLTAANNRGLSTAALKPIAAGCHTTSDGLRNEDALALQAAINTKLSYQEINPIALKPAIAPHIAAEQIQQRLSVAHLSNLCHAVLMKQTDFVLVEGAGGWRVPLNQQESLADLAKALKLPVILVVGLRLGCLNHALLTAEAIYRDQLPIAGWVANQIDPEMTAYQASIETLRQHLPVPYLGHVPFIDKPNNIEVQRYLDIEKLL